jgi:nucleoside-diphosphate-sugar epimerase
MRLLLTGASGFTGVHLAQAARDSGYTVIELNGNLQDRNSVTKQIVQCKPSHVIHLAAISAVTHGEFAEIYESNLIGSLNLLEALASLPNVPQKIILASSAYVYGNDPNRPILDEKMSACPSNHYAISKYAMELMAQTFVTHLPLIIVRPFNYTGAGHDERFVIPKIIAHYAKQANSIELGDIDAKREYNDVRDVVSIYLRLLERGQPGEIYNVASGRPVSVRSVLSRLHNLTGRELPVVQNPKFMRSNEIACLVGNGQRLVNTIGPIDWRPLDETLQWMLSAASKAPERIND